MLIGIFVLASQHENKLEFNQPWLKAQLLTKKAIPIQKLVDTGWLELVEQDASKTLAASTALAEGKQDAIPHAHAENTETETETETEIYIAHGEFHHCRLKPTEHQKLEAQVGPDQLARYIRRFDRFLEEKPRERKTRKAYLTILNWADMDGLKSTAIPAAAKKTYTEAELAAAREELRRDGVIQ